MADRPERGLAEFEGKYRLVRQITHADAPPASFTGTAVWAPRGAGLNYHEAGLLTIRGHQPMASERT